MSLPMCQRFIARHCVLAVCLVLVGASVELAAAPPKQKTVAGKADVLRHVPKKFATLREIDTDSRKVELFVEGESEARIWDVLPDAELKFHGWWGRLEQFRPGHRVWVWFAIDRKREPRAVLMMADELSEQDIHNLPHTLTAVDEDRKTVTVESKVSGRRRLAVKDLDASTLVGAQVYVQTAGESAPIIASGEQFEALRKRQQQWLREAWQQSGLPATVTFLHPLSGEMEVVLDHEAIRWGRYLQPGDEVSLRTKTPISAAVKHVRPWRERTLLRLVTASGADQFDLSLGERIAVRVPQPPEEIQHSPLPTDIGRRTSKQERIEWFLASTYCSCKVAGDRCTGMFYSLASCNENACGMPNRIREQVGEMIDDGQTDERIWQELRQLRGPHVGKQHLLR